MALFIEVNEVNNRMMNTPATRQRSHVGTHARRMRYTETSRSHDTKKPPNTLGMSALRLTLFAYVEGARKYHSR